MAGRVMVMDPIYITGDPGGSTSPESGGGVITPADLLDYSAPLDFSTPASEPAPEPSKLPVVLGVAGAGALLLWLFWPSKSKPAMAGYRRRK
jgi:hypothetical protein